MPYELLGGEQVPFRLIERFHALIDSQPEFHCACRLNPEALSGARDQPGEPRDQP